MTNTLTDRYVWAVLRSLPERQRADIERELRGSIADAVEGRLESGAEPAAAERAVIVELGDPYRLASSYADRPQQLIGSVLFPDYIRLLKVLFAIVLPISVVGVLLGNVLAHPGEVGTIIGSTVATTLGIVVHMGFWATLIFAVLERTAHRTPVFEWNPDTLPQVPAPGGITLSELVGSGIWFLFTIAFLIWAQFFSLFRDADGVAIPVLDQDLWSFWIPFFIGIAVLQLAFQFVLYQSRRWTVALATLNLLIAAAFTIPAVWLIVTAQWMNPAFLDAAHIAPLFATGGVVTIVLAILFPVIAIAASVDPFVKAIRQGRPTA